ncbi:hypothetical protein FHU30_000501 [Actinomadura rupiterrae]|nr:hypothetical protein [Actinomadura rupiterrae]
MGTAAALPADHRPRPAGVRTAGSETVVALVRSRCARVSAVASTAEGCSEVLEVCTGTTPKSLAKSDLSCTLS